MYRTGKLITPVELYETDGSLGAARGAGFGAGVFQTLEAAFQTQEKRRVIEPKAGDYAGAYSAWKRHLAQMLA